MAYEPPNQFETSSSHTIAQPIPQRPQDFDYPPPPPQAPPPRESSPPPKSPPTREQVLHATPVGPPPGGDMNEDLIFMESHTWEALKLSGEALIPFLTPDCVMLLPGADIFDANSEPTLHEILSRKDFKPWLKYEMDEIHVLPLGRDAAAISYSVEAHRHKQEYNALISSVWRREGDSWRMCLHQQTPI